ncbi:ABC transporter substrate-binding protein [Marinospirillum alkaliphilum]|uniref:Thiamine pyrimidine synthase n=1 Tax=Marinospirillum alkaliphilum DSM 21637 TaxID=1122209 RepID=A0A1K1XPJ5_9GAMM|nr:ABC transporter substrate-binding protein [Marinospirillum alkaliphilum]SFX50988.1 NMT1/THI5 like [Marinospirillum alkaliphilum DSM 21637]
MSKKNLLITGFLLVLPVAAALLFIHQQNKHHLADNAAQPIRLALVWVANPQFAGFYAADALGLYQREGLDIEFLPYHSELSVVEQLEAGLADFGIDSPDQVILGSGAGSDLLAVAAIYRINPLAFASHSALNIRHPVDFAGLRIGVLPDGTQTLMQAMLARHGIMPNAYQALPMGYDLQGFIQGDLDVIPVYVQDEPFKLQRLDIPFNLLRPQDFGIDSYGDTLITTRRFAEQHPEVTRRFIRASLQGWRYVLKHPEKARQLIEARMHEIYVDADYQQHLLAHSAPLINTGLGPLGWMETGHWQALHELLLRHQLIQQAVDVRQLFTNSFLDLDN